MENNDRNYDPYGQYIGDYPYIGWNNVWGGGGQDPGADIFVPPQKNLYYGSGLDSIPVVGRYLAIPMVALVAGLVIGYIARPKVKPQLDKLFD